MSPQIARAVRKVSTVPDKVKAEADQLIKEASVLQAETKTGEARRRFLHAISLLRGEPWGGASEFVSALALRLNLKIVDLSKPLLGQVGLSYPAAYPFDNRVLSASLHDSI